MDEINLTEEEQNLLNKLKEETKPPLEMEDNIITTLKGEGLIKDKATGPIWFFRLAAVVAFFAVGYWAGVSFQSLPTTDYNYMLVLYQDKDFETGNPQELFEEYSQWMQDIYKQGVKIDGQEMKDASLMISKSGTYDHPDRTVGGYFVVKANNRQQAMEIAKASPHYKHGGTIEIKEFMVRN